MGDPGRADPGRGSREFRGETAQSYVGHRRDVSQAVIESLRAAVDLRDDELVMDLGCGTGQLAVPISRFARAVVAVDPEPDMLAALRTRVTDEKVDNIVAVLAADRDLANLGRCVRPVALIGIANALHWMDNDQVFTQARTLLRCGGGLAVISQGPPMWLQDCDWSRALCEFLQQWTGETLGSHCGTDRNALTQRVRQLKAAGYDQVEVAEHPYCAEADLGFIVGHLRSAMSEATLPHDRFDEFTQRLAGTLEPYLDGSTVLEHIDATAVIATR